MTGELLTRTDISEVVLIDYIRSLFEFRFSKFYKSSKREVKIIQNRLRRE